MSSATRKLERSVNKANDALNSKVTITEAVQIARGVAEDVINDYHRQQASIQLSISIQLDILKELVIEKGLITEEEFKALYMKRAEEISNIQRQKMMEEKNTGVLDMRMNAGEVEIKEEK